MATLGHGVDGLEAALGNLKSGVKSAGQTNLDDIYKFLIGKNPKVQQQILRNRWLDLWSKGDGICRKPTRSCVALCVPYLESLQLSRH